jgi:hypothetical protein
MDKRHQKKVFKQVFADYYPINIDELRMFSLSLYSFNGSFLFCFQRVILKGHPRQSPPHKNSQSLLMVKTWMKRLRDKPNSRSPFAKCANLSAIDRYGKNSEGSVRRASVPKNRSARLRPNNGVERRRKGKGSTVRRPNVRHARSEQKPNDVLQKRKGDSRNNDNGGNDSDGSLVHGRVTEPWNDTGS